MNRKPITRQYALSVAQKLRRRLVRGHVPVQQIFVFGSAIKGRSHAWSDIDIAVICDPFLPSHFDELHQCNRTARTIDLRAEVVCLRPEDFRNMYSTLAQEIKQYGIAA